MRDPASFDQFYEASLRRLTSQLYAMTGDRAEAEDSVQEAFARAWQHWGYRWRTCHVNLRCA